jgi:hypothetical protein
MDEPAPTETPYSSMSSKKEKSRQIDTDDDSDFNSIYGSDVESLPGYESDGPKATHSLARQPVQATKAPLFEKAEAAALPYPPPPPATTLSTRKSSGILSWLRKSSKNQPPPPAQPSWGAPPPPAPAHPARPKGPLCVVRTLT